MSYRAPAADTPADTPANELGAFADGEDLGDFFGADVRVAGTGMLQITTSPPPFPSQPCGTREYRQPRRRIASQWYQGYLGQLRG